MLCDQRRISPKCRHRAIVQDSKVRQVGIPRPTSERDRSKLDIGTVLLNRVQGKGISSEFKLRYIIHHYLTRRYYWHRRIRMKMEM